MHKKSIQIQAGRVQKKTSLTRQHTYTHIEVEIEQNRMKYHKKETTKCASNVFVRIICVFNNFLVVNKTLKVNMAIPLNCVMMIEWYGLNGDFVNIETISPKLQMLKLTDQTILYLSLVKQWKQKVKTFIFSLSLSRLPPIVCKRVA